jgi:hypothetical protein
MRPVGQATTRLRQAPPRWRETDLQINAWRFGGN